MKKFFVIVAVFAAGLSAEEINVFPIQTDGFNKYYPSVSGHFVTWRDNSREGIYAHDLLSGSLTRLGYCRNYESFDSGSEFGPNMGGDWVVWEENSITEPTNIHAHNLSSNASVVIGQGIGFTSTPKTDGKMAVWQSGGNLHCLSLDTQDLVPISPTGNQYRPDVEGDLIVSQEGGIYAYSVSRQHRFFVGGSDLSGRPGISGNFVVWEENSGFLGIYGHDLLTGETFLISDAPGRQYYPSIGNHTVVWSDNRSGNFDIYGFDLLTRKEFPVCIAPGDQLWPSIDRNFVVWSDLRSGYADIYGAIIPEPSTILLFGFLAAFGRKR